MERRFTIGHEAGHFVGEYLIPRAQVVRIGGQAMLFVHDGDRPATSSEELRFAIAGRPLQLRTWSCTGDDSAAETFANRICVELLAPAAALNEFVGAPPARGYAQALSSAARQVEERFGVPRPLATRQLDALWKAAGGGEGFALRDGARVADRDRRRK
jgi:hypothetical protein